MTAHVAQFREFGRHAVEIRAHQRAVHLSAIADRTLAREHVTEVRHRLLPLSGLHLAPPHVHIVVLCRCTGARVPIKEETQVRVERVDGVDGIPDGNKMRGGGPWQRAVNYGVETATRMMRSSLGN